MAAAEEEGGDAHAEESPEWAAAARFISRSEPDPFDCKEACNALRAEALQWLLAELPRAESCAVARGRCKALLASQFFTALLSPSQWALLRGAAATRLRALGGPLLVTLREGCWAAGLGSVEPVPGGPGARQDAALPQPPWDDGARELRYIAALVLLGAALNPSFQSAVAAAVEGSAADVLVAAPKRFDRMQSKLTSDHRDEPPPRSAANLDVVRCACSFEGAAELLRGLQALRAAFPVVRLKNAYAPAPSAPPEGGAPPAENFGFRCMHLNVLHDPGVPLGELTRADEVQGRWRALRAAWENMDGDWELLDAAGEWLTSPALRDTPARIVGEVQLLLSDCAAARQRMHLHYTVHRSATQSDLWWDVFASVNGA